MLYYLSMHKNPEDKERKKHNFILNRFFYFFKFSFFGRVTLSRSSFIQTSIFVKTSFWSFFNMVLFFTRPFYSRQDFFLPFSKYFFLKKTNKTFISSFFIQNKLSSYFEKETEWETIFCVFSKIQNTLFLLWQGSNFVNLNKTIKFINTKTRKPFFLIF